MSIRRALALVLLMGVVWMACSAIGLGAALLICLGERC